MSEFVFKVRQILFYSTRRFWAHCTERRSLDSEEDRPGHVISPTTNSKLLSWRGILFSSINYPPLLVGKCDINWTHRLLLLLMMRLLLATKTDPATAAVHPFLLVLYVRPNKKLNFSTRKFHCIYIFITYWAAQDSLSGKQ